MQVHGKREAGESGEEPWREEAHLIATPSEPIFHAETQSPQRRHEKNLAIFAPWREIFFELFHTIPHFRRSHHSEKRSSSRTRNTRGKFHSSLVSRVVTPPSEKGILAASFPNSAGFQNRPPVCAARCSSSSRFCSVWKFSAT